MYQKKTRLSFLLIFFIFALSSSILGKKIEKNSSNQNLKKFEILANLMKKSESSIQDLECLFIKKIIKNNTEFPLSEITYRFKKNPDTIYIQYLNRYEGRKLLYIDGQNNNKILVRPEGFFSFTTISVDPFSDKAMAEDIEPITKLKFGAIISEIETIVKPKIFNKALVIKDNEKEDGIPVYRIYLKDQNQSDYFNFTIDKRTNLPYKLDYRINNNTSLLIFKDLKLNPGLKEKHFDI